MPRFTVKSKPNGATLGYAAQLYAIAGKLRGHLDAANQNSIIFMNQSLYHWK